MPTAYKPLIFLNFSKFYNYTPTKGKRHDPRRAFSLWPEDGTCSGEMNSPCAEVLPAAKRSYGANAPPRRAGPQPMSASLSSMHGTPEQAICACSGFSKGDACAYLAAAPFRDAAGYFFPEFCGAQRVGT